MAGSSLSAASGFVLIAGWLVRVISIGEVLWDVFGEEEHLGGAPFNFAAHLKRLGHEVAFVSGVGEDQRGDRIPSRMSEMALSTEYVDASLAIRLARLRWSYLRLDSPLSPLIAQQPTIFRDSVPHR